MLISRAEAQRFDRDVLLRFLNLKMPEGAQMDYKVALSRGKDEAYREFLKDVTAFANATGGLILLGVKEPEDALSAEKQVVGIADGDDLAHDLERVAATSIDPRIPGMTIKPVQFEPGIFVILVHIPSSLIRPHMVTHGSKRAFYVRHSESSVPMTTHEIRDAVLTSATSEGRALDYAMTQEREALEYIIQDKPAFLLQAMPLISLESPLNLLDAKVKDLVRTGDRTNKYRYDQFNLASYSNMTRPTIRGLSARESRDSTAWFTEVHRTGFVQATYVDIKLTTISSEKEYFMLHDGFADLFHAFCDLCEALWSATQTDVPYLFRARFFNANTTVLLVDGARQKYTPPFGRRAIQWPDQIRNVGEPTEQIWHTWYEQMSHAFGENWKVPTAT